MIDWMANYLIHSTGLLAGAWLVTRFISARRPDLKERVWKVALYAGLLTATAQSMLPSGSPWHIGDTISVTATNPPASAVLPDRERKEATNRERAPSIPPSERAIVAAQPAVMTRPAQSTRISTAASKPPTLENWTILALGAWLLGALALLADMGLSWVRLRQQLAGSVPFDGASNVIPDQRIQVLVCSRIASPIAVGARQVYVPEHFLKLPVAQQQAILAHEAGHLERRDTWWRLAGQIMERALFVQPLNRLANRQLANLAELLSDSWAITNYGAERRSLAQSLLHFAQLRSGHRIPALATPMLHGTGGLVRRVQRLLEEPHMIKFQTRGVTVALVATAVVGAGVLPGVSTGRPSAPTAPQPASSAVATAAPAAAVVMSSLSAAAPAAPIAVVNSKGRSSMNMEHVVDGLALRVRSRGHLQFNDAETDLKSISEDGYFELEIDQGGVERRVHIKEQDGAVQRRYWLDGDERAWDQEAAQWFAQALPLVFRHTGIDADARVSRLLRRGGVSAVIDEMNHMRSDLTIRIYTKHLSQQAELSSAELDDLIGVLKREVESDLEMRLALTALMESQNFDFSGWEQALAAAQTIGSDLELRLTLSAVADQMATDPVLVSAYAQAMRSIGSDLEHRLALQALEPHLGEADVDSLVTLLDATSEIGSDLEHRLALATFVGHAADPAIAQAYLQSATRIGSDLEARLALNALVESGPPASVITDLVRHAAQSIGSDLELRILLGKVLHDYGDDVDVRDAVLDATESIGSSLERNLILSKLAR